ncbi:rod shape-determining protein MreD [Cytobacillus sp. FSL W7-1323]|uniref:Rod shape-determining protein MreD n=1 Tax=Cytobacillus kochii TaxID=859143 RepID=A0A248TKV7_9BACI|nr:MULTISPECIES: rod shape-determining protein MreD [Cytobacillus]ASV68836.1 rod shape-determining protein MreD [Cytobacillus kochii]MDQ0183548.1 rod shape-determining protein MreD [Cytobacillus kochii]MEA1853276.1 rod shape-determining protein MreD [Cytobacillus sp. OWB-43]MED1603874.1 rod shape-determining protein MreD [Cytobacillus kochii]
MRKYLLPLLFIFLFVIESTFALMVAPTEMFANERWLIPHFLLGAIMLLVIFGSRKLGLLYAFIFGLLFDIVYTEIIGINLFLFPVVTYIVYQLMKILQNNLIVTTIITLFGVALMELGSFGVNYIISITTMGFSDFIFMRFIPTLILNLIFIVIVIFPLKKYFERYVERLSL